jgi:hypothetical protein
VACRVPHGADRNHFRRTQAGSFSFKSTLEHPSTKNFAASTICTRQICDATVHIGNLAFIPVRLMQILFWGRNAFSRCAIISCVRGRLSSTPTILNSTGLIDSEQKPCTTLSEASEPSFSTLLSFGCANMHAVHSRVCNCVCVCVCVCVCKSVHLHAAVDVLCAC